MRIMTRVLLGLAVACLACGCQHFNVHVMPDKNDVGLKDEKGVLKSIEIHIVAVSRTELPHWETMSMTDYWEPGNTTRESAIKHVMKFGENASTEQVLRKSDPIWKKWDDRNAQNLLVLAYLPWIKDVPGSADARRLILPYDPGKWENRYWGKDTIKIELRSGGLISLRQPNK